MLEKLKEMLRELLEKRWGNFQRNVKKNFRKMLGNFFGKCWKNFAERLGKFYRNSGNNLEEFRENLQKWWGKFKGNVEKIFFGKL